LKKLISIYISFFLVFSPLQAQSKGRAKLYHRKGIIVEGTIVNIEEHNIIFWDLLNTGKLRKQKVPNSMIYKLISPTGEVLIENSELRDEFESGKTQIEINQKLHKRHRMNDAFSYEKKKYKLIMISGSEVMFDSLVRLSGDSLLIASNQIEQYIAINLITEIKIVKKNKVLMGILVVGGAAYLTSFALLGPELGQSDAGLNFLFQLVFTGSGMILGTIGGVILGRDKNYDMTWWLTAQKRVKIQEIMNGEK